MVVIADGAWSPTAEGDGLVDGPVGSVGEDGMDVMDVVGTFQVVIALRAGGDKVAARATPSAGRTGSGGEAIALVTVPTPTQLTTVAAAVTTTQAAIGSGVSRRIQRFLPPQQQGCTKAVIRVRSQSSSRRISEADELHALDSPGRCLALAEAVFKLRDQGQIDRKFAARALIELDRRESVLVRNSVAESLAVLTGEPCTPAGLLLATT